MRMVRSGVTALFIATAACQAASAQASEPLESGLNAFRRGDIDTASRLLTVAAEQGVAEAQLQVGYLHFYGLGFPVSFPEAARWFRLAAEQGVAEAQHNLGAMHAQGVGVASDRTEAMRLFHLAGRAGYAEAQLKLGELYAAGDGVQENTVTALMWFSLAASQGSEIAVEARARLAATMAASQVEEATRLAAAWKPER